MNMRQTRLEIDVSSRGCCLWRPLIIIRGDLLSKCLNGDQVQLSSLHQNGTISVISKCGQAVA